MRNRRVLVVMVFAIGLIAAVNAGANPAATDRAAFQEAVDATYSAWANWHLDTLGPVVYDTYQMNVDSYQFLGDVGCARGTYVIVARPRWGSVRVWRETGSFVTEFDKQSDGSWSVFAETMIPQQ